MSNNGIDSTEAGSKNPAKRPRAGEAPAEPHLAAYTKPARQKARPPTVSMPGPLPAKAARREDEAPAEPHLAAPAKPARQAESAWRETRPPA